MDPKLAPAMINPKADFAVSTFIDEFTKAQKRDTQMLPKDSIAQYDTHPETENPQPDDETHQRTIGLDQLRCTMDTRCLQTLFSRLMIV